MSINLYEDLYTVRNAMFGGDSAAEQLRQTVEETETVIAEQKEPDTLHYLFLKITNYCNSDCEYCAHGASRHHLEKKQDIPASLLRKIVEDAAKLGAHTVVFSGGEPLLREEIYDLIALCCQLNMVPALLTNGTLLPQCWERLSEAGLRYIFISVDSVDKAIYEKHRGISFEMAVEGIEAAVKMKEKHPETEIHVSAVLERDNLQGFTDLLHYMNSRQIKVQISPLHDYFHVDKKVPPEQREAMTEFAEKLIAYKRSTGLIASSEPFIRHLPAFYCDGKNIPDGFSCKIGYDSLFIDALMNARCCWADSFEPVGNVMKQPLAEIWNGEKMRECRHRMLKCDCPGCWLMCTAEKTLILNESKGK